MSNNLINLQIDRYINRRAFCPVDADDSVKEQFLQTIGVEMDGQKVRVNATLTANHIMRYTNMILLSNNELAIYNGKFYEIKSANKIVERIIKAVLNCAGNYWTSRRGKEVVEVLKLIPDFQVKNLDTDNIINFSNGVLSLDDLTLHEHSPKYLCSYMLETEYNPDAECPRWDKFLKEICVGDETRIMLLQEVFGACISNARTQKAFIFYGSGANGKSVVSNILEYLCGSNNVSHLGLDKFQSTFGLQSLIGKKLNIAAELETGNTKITTANFKAVVGGDPVQINITYQAPLDTVLNCKLVFLTNNLPDTVDTSYGYVRRLLIISFNYTVPENQRNVFLTDELKEEITGILNWSIVGMLRLQQNNFIFTKCEASEKILDEYKNTINNTCEFFGTCFIRQPGEKIRKSQVYEHYVQYCALNGESCSNRADFWRAFKSHFADKGVSMQIKRVNGIDHLCDYKYVAPSGSTDFEDIVINI